MAPRLDNRKRAEGDVVDLVVAYARQETIGPLRGAGRWIAAGVASMSLLSVGLVLVALGILRAVQDLAGSSLDGSWSFVPYLIAAMCAGVIVVIATLQIKRPRL